MDAKLTIVLNNADTEDYEKYMIATIEKYEKENGEIMESTYTKIYINQDDHYVWNLIPLTDIQKKFIFINVINGEA
jgi:hypothetical protein